MMIGDVADEKETSVPSRQSWPNSGSSSEGGPGGDQSSWASSAKVSEIDLFFGPRAQTRRYSSRTESSPDEDGLPGAAMLLNGGRGESRPDWGPRPRGGSLVRALGRLHICLHSAAASDSVGDGGGASASEREMISPSEILSRSVPSRSYPPKGTSEVDPGGTTSCRLRTQLRLEAEGPRPGSAAKPTSRDAASATPSAPSFVEPRPSSATRARREAVSEPPCGACMAPHPLGSLTSGRSPASEARPEDPPPPLATLEAREGDCGLPLGKPTDAIPLPGEAGKEVLREQTSCPTSSHPSSKGGAVWSGGDGPLGSAPTGCSSTSPGGEG